MHKFENVCKVTNLWLFWHTFRYLMRISIKPDHVLQKKKKKILTPSGHPPSVRHSSSNSLPAALLNIIRCLLIVDVDDNDDIPVNSSVHCIIIY